MKLFIKLFMLTMFIALISNLQSCQQDALFQETPESDAVYKYHYKDRIYTIQTTGTEDDLKMVENQDSKDLMQLLQEKELNVETSESDPSTFYLYDESVVTAEEGEEIENRSNCIALHRVNTLDPDGLYTANCFYRGETIIAELTADLLTCDEGCNNDIVITLERYFPSYNSRTLYIGNAWDIKVGDFDTFKFQKCFSTSSGLHKIKVRNNCTQSVSTSYMISVDGYINEVFCI